MFRICEFFSFLGGKVGPGPSAYSVRYEAIGNRKHILKPTLKGRMMSKYWPGFSSSLEQPCEAPGMVIIVTVTISHGYFDCLNE